MHTMYWGAIFSKENNVNKIFKLNGNAEIFYRKESLKLSDTPIHKANTPITKRTDTKTTSKFSFDIIKNKRYTKEQFEFHVPITMNYRCKNLVNINQEVNKLLKNCKENYIIGIDRGERNLVYITLIDSEGKIVEDNQFSLNVVNNYKNYQVDYLNLLDEKHSNNTRAKQDWRTIENIKELKEGYLSQIIHQIILLANKYNALIVIEDLNLGFMNSRKKVEKEVYQKFEKMLIEKLNYLVFKNQKSEMNGGLYKAYQLTNKFDGFNKIGKQTGILFYIPAWNTSKIDPITGFVNLLHFNYANIEGAKMFISKMDDIRFNSKENYYEFDIDYDKYTDKAKDTKTKWTICTYSTRIINFRNKDKNSNWDSEEVNLTDEFNKLFAEYNIDKTNIKEELLKVEDAKLFEKFVRLFNLTMQMRNSKTGTDIDYLVSPVKDNKGNFFDSRKKIKGLPYDADANGAYNIARKGLWLIDQIKQNDSSDPKVKFIMNNKEWLQYVQNGK